jgi:hypothetical protein
MSSPGMVLIVGMERCFTTSLAQWLVDAGLCDWFVDDVKEPAIFSSDPSRALARWERERDRHDRWLLDASVAYVWSDAALDAIATLPDCRVVLCLRDQFERMVSAYRLFRAVFGMGPDEALEHPIAALKFGEAGIRSRFRDDPLAPTYLRQDVPFRRLYSLIRFSEDEGAMAPEGRMEACARDYDRFEQQNLPVRIVYEWARWTREGVFPPPTVLLNSYFTAALVRVLARIDAGRLMICTLSDARCRRRLGVHVPAFLDQEPSETLFGHHLSSQGMGFDLSERHAARARELVATEFAKDTQDLLAIVAGANQLDLSLFAPEALFHAA